MINRSAIIVAPKQPFLDWLHSVDPTSSQLTLDDLNEEPSVYLLPECDDEEAAGKRLRKVFAEIFEEELRGWWTKPSAWPERRTFGTFQRWFDWRFHSMTLDLCDGPLLREEM